MSATGGHYCVITHCSTQCDTCVNALSLVVILARTPLHSVLQHDKRSVGYRPVSFRKSSCSLAHGQYMWTLSPTRLAAPSGAVNDGFWRPETMLTSYLWLRIIHLHAPRYDTQLFTEQDECFAAMQPPGLAPHDCFAAIMRAAGKCKLLKPDPSKCKSYAGRPASPQTCRPMEKHTPPTLLLPQQLLVKPGLY